VSWLRKIQNRFRALFQKEKLEGQMDDEMRSHIEMQTQENIGIYSVLSCAVGQRSREIGIRMALGARTGGVYALILSGGMKSVLVGIGIGLVAAIFSTRFIARLLFETSATDSVTLISVALLLASTALAACFFPARRAAKVDPMVALRYE